MATMKASKTRPIAEAVEVYSPRRKAELLLGTAVDAADYERATAAVRKLGIDPRRIPRRLRGDPAAG
jgi:hypothetical protein